MDDLEVMDLYLQFVAIPPEPRPDEQAARSGGLLQDRERLKEIAALRLTEPDIQHILRDVCREASRALGLPIGLVTVLLDEAQHFAAQHGLDGWMQETQGTPVEWSFCRHTVADRASFVVNDARAHTHVKDSPLVTHDGFRCYAGMPLITSRGHSVGSLCVAGVEPREFTTGELETLQQYTAEAVRRIETRRVAVRA